MIIFEWLFNLIGFFYGQFVELCLGVGFGLAIFGILVNERLNNPDGIISHLI